MEFCLGITVLKHYADCINSASEQKQNVIIISTHQLELSNSLILVLLMLIVNNVCKVVNIV